MTERRGIGKGMRIGKMPNLERRLFLRLTLWFVSVFSVEILRSLSFVQLFD